MFHGRPKATHFCLGVFFTALVIPITYMYLMQAAKQFAAHRSNVAIYYEPECESTARSAVHDASLEFRNRSLIDIKNLSKNVHT